MGVGNSSTFAERSSTVGHFCCTSCEEHNLQNLAVIYCEECSRFFCKKCINPHKKLFMKHRTCGRGDIKKWPVPKEVEDFLRMCEAHEDKILTQFCQDHTQLCCSDCVVKIHRYGTHLYSFSYR